MVLRNPGNTFVYLLSGQMYSHDMRMKYDIKNVVFLTV